MGAADGWPLAHYYYYFALRECAQDTVVNGLAEFDFDDPCWEKAATDLKTFVDSQPFNDGFLATKAQEGATSASGLLANGQVSAEMQGHWEPGVMQGLNDGEPVENIDWFPFPAIEGGEGDPAAAIGGGDAWALSAEAPPAAVDFMQYLLSDEVQIGFAELNMGLPTNPAASASVADPTLASLLDFRDASPYVQLYFDTALGTNVGGAMNAAVVNVFAGTAEPDTHRHRFAGGSRTGVTHVADEANARKGATASPATSTPTGAVGSAVVLRAAPARGGRRMRGSGLRKGLEIAFFVTPALVVFLLFVIWPVVKAIQYSLYNWKGYGPMVDFVGLKNFAYVLTQRRSSRTRWCTTS